MLRAILFDAVGTLIYPDPPVATAYHRVGRALGSFRTLEQIQTLFRQAYQRSESLFALPGGGESLERHPTSDERERQRWRQVVGEVFSDLPQAAGDEALRQLWRHFSDPAHWRVFDDVAETWNALARRGYMLGIASNFDSRLEGLVRELEPLDQCRHLFISSQVGYPKPAPQFFQAVQSSLRLKASEILLVGDDPTNDVRGARSCGWQAQRICRAEGATGDALRSLRELVNLLEMPR